MSKKQERYAFWPYDQFPYVLSARVVKCVKDGRVQIEGYGNGASVKPIKVLSGIKGRETAEGLKQLRADFRAAKQLLAAEYNSKAIRIAPFLKKVFTT